MSQFNYPDLRRGAPKPSAILEPKVFSAPNNQERYVVEGCGAIALELFEGDKIAITNDEGGQPCEIIAQSPSGARASDVFGVSASGSGAGLRALLASQNKSLNALRKKIENLDIDLSKIQSIDIFGATTPAGECANFLSAADCLAIIAAPGEPMDFERQNTATPLSVEITRANPNTHARFALPEPLAEITQDIRIHSATAESFFVKAGEYIQVIDVDGRQCTDFQCFDARKLDKGRELALDVTTTRTLMGHAYPLPGLHAKYYDQDMTPLVEVVQDSCGRHDAFALACTAKYYDDIGYPGHINCSDNFNLALERFNVGNRPGWMAINFFFNTGIDEHGVMYSDEPWSRPGDYVLLRALTDIVCVNSACPDDTTPANGWNPTDIHIRIYKSDSDFERSIGYRSGPNSEMKMTKKTAFYDRFAEQTRNFVEYNGYWLPNCIATEGPLNEYWSCRKDVVMMDLSPLRKFEITGPDSEALCQYIFTRNVKKLSIGEVVYTAMCYPHGGMIDDGTLFKLGKDNFRWIGGSDYGGEWIREKADELGLKVLVRSSTDMQHNIAVQGPKSRDLLKEIIWTAPHNPKLEELGWFRFTPARIGDDQGVPIVLSRTGYTGELGYEIFCHPKDGSTVFDAVWEAGQNYQLSLLGLEALDMLRIEAGLIFAGYEFSDETDPFEAGIGFTVPLKSKEDDFIGRDALIRRKEHPARKMVGLDIEAETEVAHGDPIYVGRAQIGVVTSSTRSPILNKNIALARVDVTHSELGSELEIGKLDGLQKRLLAKIVPLSHYDPKKERPRS